MTNQVLQFFSIMFDRIVRLRNAYTGVSIIPPCCRKAVVSCLLFLSAAFAEGTTVVPIEYYFQTGCNECQKVNAFILPRLTEHYSGKYKLIQYDIGIPENYLKLAAAQEKLDILDNNPVCMIVGGTVYLGGYEVIERSLFDAVEQVLAQSAKAEKTTEPDTGTLQRRGEKITAGMIIIAGLVDGINPCVFATLVFLISLLALARVNGQTLFWVGGIYCLACFLSYLALGFGLFRFLRLLTGFHAIQNILDWLLTGILLVFAFLSFRDAWYFRRSKSAREILLQLPKPLKQRIHNIIKRGLTYRFLIPGAFVTGFLVTILESVCTGQVYVPTLVLLTREFGTGSRWFLYLLLYNLMFILPLLIIFYMAWGGTNISAFLRWSRKHVIWSKVTLGCFFLMLAGLMSFLRWGNG